MKGRLVLRMRPVMCHKRGCGITLDDLEAKLVANHLFGMLHSLSQRMDEVLLATINPIGLVCMHRNYLVSGIQESPVNHTPRAQ
jgi:hypothetical protein